MKRWQRKERARMLWNRDFLHASARIGNYIERHPAGGIYIDVVKCPAPLERYWRKLRKKGIKKGWLSEEAMNW